MLMKRAAMSASPLERAVAFYSLATSNANVDLGEHIKPVFGLRAVADGLQNLGVAG